MATRVEWMVMLRNGAENLDLATVRAAARLGPAAKPDGRSRPAVQPGPLPGGGSELLAPLLEVLLESGAATILKVVHKL